MSPKRLPSPVVPDWYILMKLQRQSVTQEQYSLEPSGNRDGASLKLAKRRRPGDSQREQKEQTRKKLLEAAQIVFGQNSYTDTAVEMVADQAGVSRTTFYRHFDGKLPLALALFEEMAPRLKSTWNELFDMPSPKVEQVQIWLKRLMNESAMNQVLISVFSQMEATETDAHAHKFSYYDEIWRLSEFESKLNANSTSEMRAKFLLIMLQVDQFLYLIFSRTVPIEREQLELAMANIVHGFVAEVRELAKAK